MNRTTPVKTDTDHSSSEVSVAAPKAGWKRAWSILFPLLQYAAAGWFLWFYFKTVRGDWGEIVRYGFHPRPLWFGSGALLIFLGYTWQPAAFWYNFKFTGVAIPVRDSYKIYCTAHLAGYLPGRIWSYLSFAYLGKFLGIAPEELLAALYLGFAASLLSGALFSAFALPLFKQLGIPAIALALFCALLLMLFIPKVFHTIIRAFGRLTRKPMAGQVKPFGVRAIFMSSLSYGLSWTLISVGVVLLVLSLHPLTAGQLLYSFAAFPLSYLAGYLAFFAVGGLGVREGVMLAIFSAFLPMYAAATVPIAARILTLTYEGLWFLVAWQLPWKSNAKDGVVPK